MTDEFRAAFQRVLDTAASQAPDFPDAVHDVFRLSSHVPTDELAIALEALTPVLSDSEPAAGIAADLAVLAGALVESGAPAGEVGLEVLRQLGRYGQAAVAFMHAWDKTGGGPLPGPTEVGEPEEARVEEVLGENAPLATVGWWTSLRYGLAAKAMLGDSEVRAAVRADASALDGLGQIVQALSTHLSEFREVAELLRMAEADSVLVLERASQRGFRVRFDGISDNFQLHTLLADALIGKEGRMLAGTRPDPRWTAACLDAPADPLADVVEGEWDLVGGDGTWVGNEAVPGDIPVVDGERVLVLETQSLSHSWRAGRRHPHIIGSLSVVSELPPDQAMAWWARVHPAGSVRHPLATPIEHDDTGAHRPPRHFGVAAHFAEVDSGPMQAPDLTPEFTDGPEHSQHPEHSEPGAGRDVWPRRGGLDATPAPEAPVFPQEPPQGTPPPPGPPEPWGVPQGFLEELARGPEPDPAPQPDPEAAAHPWAEDPLPDVAPFPGFVPPPADEAPPLPAPSPAPAEEPPAVPAPLAPGARLLPPMPPGVSDSSTWAPDWKWPLPPRHRPSDPGPDPAG
ncbi:hypothetical protein DFP74_1993 [Nocardiopsis sp. Huas11]|uniref:hypothetical protein n=1 Tax=Nocardiopsis sp. Huas11 TaxID=2183912 RepID=UPI000EB0FB3F|nr:hypothetical protein [Nocardiopsis sp. Huas11]RKS06365.1 hypothetical protein DFP74_1993 [Nocardiopsis sp. Huas11]